VAFIVIVIGLIALIGLDLQRQLSVVLLRLATIALTLVQLQRLGTAPPVNTGARPRSRTRLVFSFTVVVIVLIAVLAAIGFIAG
jgi:hypothetical protein